MKTFLLTGRSGVGKSSLVNSVFSDSLAKIDRFEPCTRSVGTYVRQTDYGHITLIDTPGLAEGDPSLDDARLKELRAQLDGVGLDAVLYVTPLKETRFRDDDRAAMTVITRRLGPEVWASTWLILTFAASRPEAERRPAVDHLTAELRRTLRGLAPPQGSRAGFRDFTKVLLVDNVVGGWSPECRPCASFLG